MIASPLLISFITALLCMVFRQRLASLKLISFLGSFFNLLFSSLILRSVLLYGRQELQFGGLPAPYGISFSIQILGAILVCGSALIAFTGNWAMQFTLHQQDRTWSFHTLFHFMMMGVYGAFSTSDIFNLFVWFEVLLISSFILVALSRQWTSMTGAFKYASLSIVSSVIFLLAVSFIYASIGTLDTRLIISQIREQENQLGAMIAVSLFIIAFAIKAALFPFFFWLPASYPATITPIAAVFSGFLTKVGIFSILQLLVPLAEVKGYEIFLPYLYGAALISMVLGVFGALSRDNMKAILAFHSISQIGYITLGISLGTTAGLSACIFYIIHHMLVKTNLFFTVAYIEGITGTSMVSESGGLWSTEPLLGASFAFSALSLVGLPPLSGFWAKLSTIQASLSLNAWLAVTLSLTVSLFTLMSMLKIWTGVFWKEPPPSSLQKTFSPRLRHLLGPLMLLNLCIFALSMGSSEFMRIAEKAVNELRLLDKGTQK